MNSAISQGINILVETSYQSEYSNPTNNEFLFVYKITITNHNHFAVKLLRRHWFISDSNGATKEVEGEGVVGNQPIIFPSESYQYISSCILNSEIGKMQGNYLMENLQNKLTFKATIPIFMLEAPSKLN
jgi:ApaG protein